MTEVARLVFPALRWDSERRDWDGADRIERLSGLGVGGWILFGGPVAEVSALTARLRSESGHPILIGADLERGAGQQFDGATRLPPAAALVWLDDIDATRRAGRLTGEEAVALGVDWVYAPVADMDVEPANPIVGTRSFGDDPAAAARHVAAWVEGCREAGAMACAKHFPGHGRTTADSHLGLPVVDADADALDAELAPFRAAIDAGVDGVMTAHVAYPSLDPSGAPATLSRPILQRWLRERLGFRGLVVTDALIMEGAAGGGDVAAAAVRAVAAGCDALLYPPDPEAVVAALDRARGEGIPEARLAEAVARIEAAAEARTAAGAGTPVGGTRTRAWALELAARTVHVLRGAPSLPGTVELVTVDDDVGGPYPAPSRTPFSATLTRAGRGVIPVDVPRGPAVVAVYADIRGFKGRPGLNDGAVERVERALAASPSSLVVLFGHPRLEAELPGENVLCAWGGEAIMQEAAAVWLVEAAG